jgi:hypothetical protein
MAANQVAKRGVVPVVDEAPQKHSVRVFGRFPRRRE